MTVSLHKKSKEKRYRNDLSPSDRDWQASLTDVLDDEDAIDRLLMNTGFDSENDFEAPELWDGLIEERDDPIHFERPVSDKIEPLIAAYEDGPGILLSVDETVQSQQKPSFIDELSEKADFITVEPVSCITEDHTDFPRSGITRAENLQVEDLIGLEATPRQNELSEAEIAWNPELLGNNSAAFVDEVLPASISPINSERDSLVLEEKQLLHNLETKTKKAIRLSYIALGISIASAAAAVVLTIAQAQQGAYGLSEQVSLPGKDTSGPIKKTGDEQTAEGEASFGPLSSVSMSVSNETVPAKTAVLEGSRDSDEPAQPLNEVFISREADFSKSGWFVNLLSFRQRGDAEQQAFEFMKKGIRTEIIEVEVNKTTWYRLRVGGFTRQEQAAAYAEKIKKPLQLNSIWIASN
ncbi:MAG: SPOR domain-containing protein [Methylosarcina sp.]